MDSGISNSEGHSSGRISIPSGALIPQMPVPNQFQLDRTRPGSPFFPAMGQFLDQRLGASPGMLLPPIAAQSHAGAPPDNLKAIDGGTSTTTRLAPPDGRGLLVSEGRGMTSAHVGGNQLESTPAAQLSVRCFRTFVYCKLLAVFFSFFFLTYDFRVEKSRSCCS